MDHGNGQLLPISLGDIVLRAALGHAAPNNLAGADINHVKYSLAIKRKETLNDCQRGSYLTRFIHDLLSPIASSARCVNLRGG